jgi:hypothetical protein
MREAELTRQLLAAGLAALVRANHMDKGRFSQSFFDLSIGLERLLKLIYLIDHAIQNDGAFPSDGDLRRRFGHDLSALYEEAGAIRRRLQDEGEQFMWAIPDPTLSRRIVGVLAEFAKATRYYNLDYLLGSKNPGRDPITAWNDDVGQYLMSEYPARLRRKDEEWATEAEGLLAGRVILRQETEGGDSLRSVNSSVLHGRRGEWIQRQAAFHCAVLIRDLVEVLLALSDRTGPGRQPELPAFHEYFGLYYNDDRFLKSRRTFLE